MASEIKVYSATMAGPHHQLKGSANQDFSDHRMVDDNKLILALADGAGSLELSHRGARLAVATALDTAEGLVGIGVEIREAIYNSLASARDALLSHEDSQKMGCTLTLALIDGEEWAVGSVGDSFALLFPRESDPLYVSEEPAGEFANITTLLTSSTFEPLILEGTTQLEAIVLSSDGLQSIAIEGANMPHMGFWRPLIDRAALSNLDLEAFLSFLSSKEQISDDTTIILAYFGEQAEPII